MQIVRQCGVRMQCAVGKGGTRQKGTVKVLMSCFVLCSSCWEVSHVVSRCSPNSRVGCKEPRPWVRWEAKSPRGRCCSLGVGGKETGEAALQPLFFWVRGKQKSLPLVPRKDFSWQMFPSGADVSANVSEPCFQNLFRNLISGTLLPGPYFRNLLTGTFRNLISGTLISEPYFAGSMFNVRSNLYPFSCSTTLSETLISSFLYRCRLKPWFTKTTFDLTTELTEGDEVLFSKAVF